MTSVSETNKHRMNTAATAGLIASSKIGFVSGGCGLLLNRFVPRFQKLRVSAKLAICFSPALFAFAYVSERAVHNAGHIVTEEEYKKHLAQRPALKPEDHPILQEPRKHLPAWQSAANFVYHNPFNTIIGLSVPTVAAVFFTRDADLLLTQRFFHTRVLGQTMVVSIVLGVFVTWAGMNNRGGEFR